MKRALLLLFCCVACIAGATAQSDTPTSEELSFRSKIMSYLKSEGFSPTIDNDDNSANFKYEGTSYWITVKGSEPTYITFYEAANWDISSLSHKGVLEACNNANSNTRCGKACIANDQCWFTVEYYCFTFQDFRDTFYKNIAMLQAVKKATKDYYSQHYE